jgi:hypothetical protein
LNHSPIFSSHQGRNRTLDLLCIRFYLPGMRKDVQTYVQNCDECQRSEPRHEYRAPQREFAQGDVDYVYSPAIKVGVSSKFRRSWTGPYRVIARKSQLTYAVVNQQGKKFVIHVNRMKRAYDPSIWKEGEKDAGTFRTKRRKTEEEEEEIALLPASNPFRAPHVVNPHPGQNISNRRSPPYLDTPTPVMSPRADPNYVPSDTPRSRRQLEATRSSPPVTRFRSRMQAISEAADDEQIAE